MRDCLKRFKNLVDGWKVSMMKEKFSKTFVEEQTNKDDFSKDESFTCLRKICIYVFFRFVMSVNNRSVGLVSVQ